MANNPISHPADFHEHAPDLEATQARQGAWGLDVFWVLIISSIVAALALGAAWIYWSPALTSVQGNNGASVGAAGAFHASPSQPLQTPAPTPTP